MASVLKWQFLALTVIVNLWAQAKDVVEELRDYSTPTKKLKASEYPLFSDDIAFENMSLVIDRQLKRYREKNMNGVITLGGVAYPQRQIVKTLIEFRRLAGITKRCLQAFKFYQQKNNCFEQFNKVIRKKFHVFAPDLKPGDDRYGQNKDTFFTGYYTPSLKGSLTQTEDYPWAVYGKPSNDQLSRSTREQIDFEGVLKGRGLELFYAANLFDVYNLHVEGGGKVVFVDGSGESPTYLNYAGTNKRSWKFISIYMRRKGMIQSGSNAAQREYLLKHPEKQREVFSFCPSYVYFEESKKQPNGSDMVSLTNKRSIATDSKLYRLKGMLSFVVAERPKELNKYSALTESVELLKMKSFSRFYLDQDTGGAIKGKGRADLYFGEGEYAAYAAANQQVEGNIYFLLLK